MTTPLWALAAGCVPDAAPCDIPRIAAAAGFRSSGMWVDPKTTWGRDALAKTQLDSFLIHSPSLQLEYHCLVLHLNN